MSTFQQDPICVLKFGSSVLRSAADLPAVVHKIYGELRRGRRLIVVVSALGRATDELLAQARAQTPQPDERDLAQLLATGETTSAALLSLALKRAGVNSRLIAPGDIGFVTEGGLLDASPVGLDTAAIERELELAPVLVLPGFIGRHRDGSLSLLGRGGSDLTAIFVAGELGKHAGETRCVLVKDVDGLFEWDPAGSAASPPRRYTRISYGDALELSGDVVQHKAIRLAREFGLRFEVGNAASLGAEASAGSTPTRVGPAASSLKEDVSQRFTRLRIGIAGHGTVGAGVLDHLLRSPEEFEVAGVLVRNLDKHRQTLETNGSPALDRFDELFTQDEEQFFSRGLDVFVEVAGGLQPAERWTRRALDAGVEVVTANKALLAERGRELRAQARAAGVGISFSASVGGSAPLLEAARRLSASTVRGFEAVLNGTSNFVLDSIARGASLEGAVRDAQSRGFAEADPQLDLDGTDACQKAELLARELYGPEVSLRWGTGRGVLDINTDLFAEARGARGTVRIVASCYLEETTPEGGPKRVLVQVGPVVLPGGHPLAQVSGAGAGVVFDLEDPGVPRQFVSGEGAGRWPTAEAVLADLFDLRCSSRATLAVRSQR